VRRLAAEDSDIDIIGMDVIWTAEFAQAKWIKEITFSDKDEKGFWEVRGYSNSALPWKNDRYG